MSEKTRLSHVIIKKAYTQTQKNVLRLLDFSEKPYLDQFLGPKLNLMIFISAQ